MGATRANYEKVICACCLLLLFTNVGLASTSFNVYQPHIVAAIGDERGSDVLLLRTLVSLICMIFAGKWYERLDCRLGASLAGCLTSIGFMIFSFSTSFAGYCIGAVFTGAGYGLGGMVGSTILIGRWYKTKVGTALGIVAAGSSISAMIIPVAATYIINVASLSWSYRFESILAIALAALCFALIRNNPEDIGFIGKDDATPSNGSSAKSKSEGPRGSSEPLSATTRRVLWLAMVLMGCVAVDGWNYMSVLMTHAGFDESFAAALLSVAAIAMFVGKLSTGALFDRIGTLRASILFFSILTAGLVACIFADFGSAVLMVAGVVLLGFGMSLGTVGISVWSIDLSTPIERSKLIKNLQVAYATGGFLFNLVPGRIVEAGGSYTYSYAILAALCLIEAAIVISIYLRKRRQS